MSGWREPRRGVLYQDASQQLQAAIDGQGVGLVRRSLAMQAILDGQLTRLFNVEVPSPFSYWMVCPEPLQEARRACALRDWLHAVSYTHLTLPTNREV